MTDAPPAPEPVEPGRDAPHSDDELGRRLDHLAVRVEAMAGLVESLFDRVDQSVESSTALTTKLGVHRRTDLAAALGGRPSFASVGPRGFVR